MTPRYALPLAYSLFFCQVAVGQLDTVRVVETTTADWTAGTLDSLDATSDMLKLTPLRTHQFGFSNCGQTGRFGPTQAACSTAYAGTSVDGAVSVNAGIQEWTTPEGGIYRILARGAGHGADTVDYLRGAMVQADVELLGSAGVRILVGQMGRAARGGSGGTFVALADNTPILVAGGAAGMRSRADEFSRGSTSTSGQSVVCGATGGTDGGGGLSLGGGNCSGAGGGFLGDGQGCGGGLAFVNGGVGGDATYPGGFGGGGAVNSSSSPGGGGGYSGGSVQYTGGGSSCAGGGGSYVVAGARNLVTSDGLYDNSATFNGDSVASFNAWHLGQGSVQMEATEYVTLGVRVSPVHDISHPTLPYALSVVEWDADMYTGTTLTVETRHSLDGGINWSPWAAVTQGAPIPGLPVRSDMTAARVQTRMTFATTALFASPMVRSLTITVVNSATAGIADRGNGLVSGVKVYPNPFENTVTVGYTLTEGSKVGYRLVSLLGQPLLAVEEGMRPAGHHVREIDLSGLKLAPGMYWMEVLTDGQPVREKLMRR